MVMILTSAIEAIIDWLSIALYVNNIVKLFYVIFQRFSSIKFQS